MARSLQMATPRAADRARPRPHTKRPRRARIAGREAAARRAAALSDGSKRATAANRSTPPPFTKGNKPVFHDPLHNFVKLRLWELEQFDSVVFLDADTLVIHNIDKLFGYPEFSAAPNLYESLADFHRLNSGVFSAKPSCRTYASMLARLDQPDAFWKRTDQTFLEAYSPTGTAPYTYNTLQIRVVQPAAAWTGSA